MASGCTGQDVRVQRRARGTEEFPIELVRAARETYLDLCKTQREIRLLHGDLQHHNVHFDKTRGWLAIDPKGVVAELELELGAPMRNPHARVDLFQAPVVEQRVRQFADGLGVDAARVIRWTFSQAVLSAIWSLQDKGVAEKDSAVVSLAHTARSLVQLRSLSGGDDRFKIWDVSSGRIYPADEVPGWDRPHSSDFVAISPDQRLLAIAKSDGTVELKQLPGWDDVRALRGHRGDARTAGGR